MAMKLNEKQIDDIARLLGTLAASSVIGLSVGAARPESVTSYEEVGLISSAIVAFSMMLYTRS
jgi:hypothetical protein